MQIIQKMQRNAKNAEKVNIMLKNSKKFQTDCFAIQPLFGLNPFK
jgi:hypothetical protein